MLREGIGQFASQPVINGDHLQKEVDFFNKHKCYLITTGMGKSVSIDNSLFIPSGRQLLSLPTDSYPLFNQGRVDLWMENFMMFVKDKKVVFGGEQLWESGNHAEKKELIELTHKLCTSILKGKYVNTREGERIYFDDKQFVKLYEASSGQQESLWILNIMLLQILGYNKAPCSIIEEPEAHLYPETQRDVTNLISLLANQPGNQVMITTHSPYILSALNNLLYANKVGKTKPDEVAEIVDPLLWVDIGRVAAYKVENGEIRDIVDRRTSDNPDGLDMIILEEIDAIPKDTIVEDYERLFELDDCSNAN